MRICYVGDVVGRSGREALLAQAERLKSELKLDALIVNVENAAGGFGATPQIARAFLDAGVDAMVLGNHAFDQREIMPYLDQEPRLIRPLNLGPGAPGRGMVEIDAGRGRKLLVVQLICRLFMPQADNPFVAIDQALARVPGLASGNRAIMVDLHGEATSEKYGLGHHLDGRVSLIAGTHTHAPTADAQILERGSAYVTDVGMTGDFDSVIGMDKTVSLARWRSSAPGPRLSPAMGEATLCAVYCEIDDASGLARRIEPIRLGPRLANAWPGVS